MKTAIFIILFVAAALLFGKDTAKDILSGTVYNVKKAMTWKAFWKDNGYQHLILWLTTILACLNHTDFGIGFVGELIIAGIIALGIGYIIERGEVKISQGTKVSFPDIIWGMVGAKIGVAVHHLFPSVYLEITLAVISALLLFRFVIQYFNARR